MLHCACGFSDSLHLVDHNGTYFSYNYVSDEFTKLKKLIPLRTFNYLHIKNIFNKFINS